MKIIIYANRNEWPEAIVAAHELMDVATHTAVRDIKTHPDYKASKAAVEPVEDQVTTLDKLPIGARFTIAHTSSNNILRVLKKNGKKPGIKCIDLWTGEKSRFYPTLKVINLEAEI